MCCIFLCCDLCAEIQSQSFAGRSARKQILLTTTSIEQAAALYLTRPIFLKPRDMHPLYSQSFQQLTRAAILPSASGGAFDNVPGADLRYVSVLPLATSATVLIPAL